MSPRGDSRAAGQIWETRAAEYLEANGLRVIARSWTCRLGELDIVCEDKDALVVVEVRARGRHARSSAAESIGPHKRRRIVQATRHFLMRHPGRASQPIRFDVVAIDGIDTDSPAFRWIRHAFDTA
jgi:putative endonuclease